MGKNKYDILTPNKGENVNNKAMPLRPAPQLMKSASTPTSDALTKGKKTINKK